MLDKREIVETLMFSVISGLHDLEECEDFQDSDLRIFIFEARKSLDRLEKKIRVKVKKESVDVVKQ